MSEFTQKYTIVQFFKDVPDGFEYSMKDWPLHVTIVDVFAANGKWSDVLDDLKMNLSTQPNFSSNVVAEDLFGDDASIKVKLLERNNELQHLHDNVVDTLEKYRVEFNSPEYTRTGFKPHSTDRVDYSLEIGDTVEFNAISLVDMFPNDDPYRRRVLGTIHFQ